MKCVFCDREGDDHFHDEAMDPERFWRVLETAKPGSMEYIIAQNMALSLESLRGLSEATDDGSEPK